MTLDRRHFLLHSGAAAVAASSRHRPLPPLERDGPLQYAVAGDPAAAMPAIPFHGQHQAGIVNPPPPAGLFVAFDVTAGNRAGLEELLRTLTGRARFLSGGGLPPDLGVVAPPSDSGTLGPAVVADGLTVTVGAGSTLFDGRFGLARHRPAHLTPMRSFPNDDLDPAWCGGDLFIQICAGSLDTALHALRDIAKHTRGGMQIRWRLDGFVSPPRPSGVPRNNLAFKDGIANPDVADPAVARRLLWVVPGIGEPGWATGGCYHVVRLIRMYIEFWDRVSLSEQELMIGRHRDSGAPLGQRGESEIPAYAYNQANVQVPPSAHIRLANPRTRATENSRIFRRGYNYDKGVDLSGNLDVGLIFNCFQQNLRRQFEANQNRLIGEALVDYISPFGGGYFFVLPGARGRDDWLGRTLMRA